MLETFIPIFFLAYVAALLRFAPGLLNRSTPSMAGWCMDVHHTGILFSTRGFNELAARVTDGLGAKRVLRRVYSLGTAVGVLGSVVVSGGVIYTAVQGGRAVWGLLEGHPNSTSALRGHLSFIPGLTAPWWHLPTLLLGLYLAQLAHEGGHAIAASVDDIRPTAFVVKFHVLIPSARLIFPSTIDDLPRSSRLRIVSGGAFHCFLLHLLLLSASRMYPYSEGRAIVDIESKSGLDRKLQVGDVVTHVNAVEVGNQDWNALVHAPLEPEVGGWCVPSTLYHSAPSAPCEPTLVTFVQVNELDNAEEANHCLEPHDVVNRPIGDCACQADEVCIRPALDERIMRLRYIRNGFGRVFMWKGEKTVLLGLTLAEPRSTVMNWIALFLQYFKMASLAFCLLPLLPLSLVQTDGTKILDIMFSSNADRLLAEDYELEAGERKSPAPAQVQKEKDARMHKVQTLVTRTVSAALAVSCVAGVVLLWS